MANFGICGETSGEVEIVFVLYDQSDFRHIFQNVRFASRPKLVSYLEIDIGPDDDRQNITHVSHTSSDAISRIVKVYASGVSLAEAQIGRRAAGYSMIVHFIEQTLAKFAEFSSIVIVQEIPALQRISLMMFSRDAKRQKIAIV